MIYEINENTVEGRAIIREINKHPHIARRIAKMENGIPEGYLSAEEWKEQALQMADEVFDEYVFPH